MSDAAWRCANVSGTIAVPDALHNLYGIDATVSSCGALDGRYRGMGTLVDAEAMQDWMTAMHPLDPSLTVARHMEGCG